MEYIYKIAVSTEAPKYKGTMWLKPVEGGFTLYALVGGKWQPLKLVDDNAAASVADDKAKVTVKVTDIKEISDKQCKALNLGDQVIKSTGTQKHLYTVTYKDDVAGEMCLNYFDYETIEEVYYEVNSEGKWAWESTNTTNLGG